MFAHKLTEFTSAVWPQATSVMQWAACQMNTFDDDVEVKWAPADRAEKFQIVRESSTYELHAVHIGLVEGEGFDLVEPRDVVAWRLGEIS